MKKTFMIVASLVAATFLSACGEQVEIPPANVGKILTPNGFSQDILPPSRFRLNFCMAPGMICDKLVTVEASDKAFEEKMEVFMPKDQLLMSFDIRATVTLMPDRAAVVFDRLVGEKSDDGRHISMTEVYNTYAAQRIRTVARTVLAEYSINQITENREAIEAKLTNEIQKSLGETPIQAKFIGLADVSYPSVIIEAKVKAEERRIAIEQEKANREIELTKQAAALDIAKAEQAVRLTKAETIRKENELTAASVTDKYLAYRRLEVMEEMAKNPSTVFFPAEMLMEGASTQGLNTRIFGKGQ